VATQKTRLTSSPKRLAKGTASAVPSESRFKAASAAEFAFSKQGKTYSATFRNNIDCAS
jgi:hypothetical protein